MVVNDNIFYLLRIHCLNGNLLPSGGHCPKFAGRAIVGGLAQRASKKEPLELAFILLD
jgi:hypothetical protein